MKKTCTLEQHLHHLAEESEEVKGLESVYTLQKKKLNRYLSSVSTTFPTYSSHDTEHSRSIISSIEMILGEKYIRKLSGVDTFLILTCAYMHDIGMLYSDEEVRELWESTEFQNYLKECKNRGGEVKKAAEMVCNGFGDVRLNTPLWPLELRRSTTILLMDYYRPLHGGRVEKNSDSSLKGIPEMLCLDESFIPRRLNEMVNRISMAHTGNFESLLDELPHEDSYGREFFHPRMIAFLLRIGDLCDLDNNRFNKVSIATFGTLGDESLAHYFKHTSVRTLYLSHDMIKIVADVNKTDIINECKREWLRDEKDQEQLDSRIDTIFQNTVREHIKWRSMMEGELRDAKLNGKKIFPKGWKYLTPELQYEIRINGEKVVAEDANLRFLFPQERAFQLIEGISIYGEEKFIFVRELLQNAIDASKIQLWRDVQANYSGQKSISPFDMHRDDNNLFDRYRIDIRVGLNEDKTLAHIEIGDHGIGINRSELKENILTTGKSWSKREEYKDELKNMPEWLKPTGSFGIGLHTVFYVTDHITILSKSDTEPFTNRITLNSGKKEGYAFCETIREPHPRGSTFKLDIDLSDESVRDELGYGSGTDFLKAVETDLERKLVQMFEDHCALSLFPVYVNDMRLARGLAGSEQFACLGGDEEGNIFLDIHEQERYQWIFGKYYESLELWDREHNIAVKFQMDEESTTCLRAQHDSKIYFRGMRVQKGLELPEQETCLKLVCLDLEQGESGEVMNAGRDKFGRDMKRNLVIWLKEYVTFAEGKYIELMETVHTSDSVVNLETEADTAASAYIIGQMNVSEVWKAACRIRGELLPLKPNLDVESKKRLGFETRVATHMIHCTVLDRIFYRYVQHVVNMKCETMEEWLKAIPVYPFPVLDDLIRRWKCDWKTEKERFNQPYFGNEIVKLIQHYLVIFGMAAVDFHDRQRIHLERLQCLQFEKNTEMFLKKNMPFLAGWKKGVKELEVFSQVFGRYCGDGRSHFIRIEKSVCEHLLKPASACAFEEWRFKGAFAGDNFLSLKLSAPYMPILLSLLGGKETENSPGKSIWKEVIGNTAYAILSYGSENLSNLSELPEVGKIVLLAEELEKRDDLLPFLDIMDITMAVLQPGRRKIGYTKVSAHIAGVEADEESIRFAFSTCLNHMTLEADRGYKSLKYMCGFSKYEYIIIRSEERSSDLYTGVTSRHWQIPLWDYNMKILEQLELFSDKSRSDNFGKCQEAILNSGCLERVTEYIFRKRKEENHPVEMEKIRQQYNEFVVDFLHVWWGDYPLSYG